MEYVDINFEMTYPCFILMQDDGLTPRVLLQGDEKCLCLFTDEDLVKAYHVAHIFKATGLTSGRTDLKVAKCDDRHILLAVLDEWTSELAEDNVRRVAIDATPGKMIGSALLTEFTAALREP